MQRNNVPLKEVILSVSDTSSKSLTLAALFCLPLAVESRVLRGSMVTDVRSQHHGAPGPTLTSRLE